MKDFERFFSIIGTPCIYLLTRDISGTMVVYDNHSSSWDDQMQSTKLLGPRAGEANDTRII